MLTMKPVILCLITYCEFIYASSFLDGLKREHNELEDYCGVSLDIARTTGHIPNSKKKLDGKSTSMKLSEAFRDPIIESQNMINNMLFGFNSKLSPVDIKMSQQSEDAEGDPLLHKAMGEIWRSETYANKSAVHLPMKDAILPGHCRLEITKDFMQTAINAFGILIYGNVQDVMNLPASYVLSSTRTISMMKLCNEKFVAMWTLIKGSKKADEITHETLELFRPLFKYVNAREMSQLNLRDNKILTFIGTHPELNRHQVGVVANAYIKLNPSWSKPKYLNLMNNLLCGVPMAHMKEIDEAYFLKLTEQVFYHIRACDPLQRHFYLKMMTKTQALGKPYSWSARDVTRLGLLLAEVTGPDLSTINPAAMAAISSQVMLEMSAENLKYITEIQLRHIEQKSLNILAKKLKTYQNEMRLFDSAHVELPFFIMLHATSVLMTLI